MKTKAAKMVIAMAAAVLALALSGCATPYDVSIEKETTQRVTSHNAGQSNQVMYRSNAVSEIAGGYECSDPDSKDCGAAQGMMKYRAFEALEKIKGEQYAGPVGKTGVDVQHEVAKNGVPITATITSGVVSTAAVRKDKGNTRINSQGDATYAPEETHTTALGEGSGANSNYKNPATTEVVAPMAQE